jgi:hypothetical protein
LVLLQTLVQSGIPGRWAHGVLSEVPLFESTPVAFET